MAVTIGRLVIDLTANVAQLRTDMQSAAGVVEQAGGAITSAANFARTALGALGVAFSASEVKAWAEGVINSTGALNDFAQKTGSSVENLSRLANQAAVSGKDFATLEQLTLKLAVNMRDMGDDSKAAGAALAYLGVTARDPAEALLEVAVAMERYADGAGKAALAKDLFGRNGPQYIDFLHDLAQAHGVGATRTTEQARAADELEESWRRLKVEGTFFSSIILNEIVPALQKNIDYFRSAREAGLGVWSGLTTGLPTWIEKISQIGGEITTLTDKLNTLKGSAGSAWDALGIKGGEDQLVKYQELLQRYTAARDGYIATWVSRLGYVGDKHDQMVQNSAASLSKLTSDYKGAGEAIKAADFTSTIHSFQEQLDKLTGADGGMSNFNKAMNQIIAAQKEGKVVTNEMAAALLAVAGELDNATIKAEGYKNALKEWEAQEKAFTAAQASYNKVLADAQTTADAYLRTLGDIATSNLQEIETLGMSAEQIRVVNAAREIDRKTREKLLELGDKIDKQTKDQIIAAGEEAKASVAASVAKTKAYQDWYDLMQTATAGVKNFIVDFVEHGSSAFKNLWQNFKRWALEALAEIAAKQIVVSVVGALGLGGSAGASAAGALGLGGAGNGLTTLLGLGNSASSIAGGGSLLGGVAEGIGSTLFGSVGGGAFATGLTSPLGTITTLLGGSGGATIGAGLGLEAALGAAIPLVGLGLGVASLLGAFDSGGGPMTRNYGLAGGNLSTFSELSSLHKLVGTDAAQQGNYDAIAQGMLNTYNTVLQQLGVASGANAAFAVYSSQDPQGSALSTVDVRAMLGGQSVYVGNTGETVARTQEALQAEIDRQVTAAILAAISSSGVSQQTILAAYQNLTPAQQAQNQSLYSYLMQSMGPPVAIDNFGATVGQQGSAATTMQAAADTMAAAANQLAGAGSQIAGAATTYQDATATYYDAAIQRYMQTGMP